MSKVLAAVRAVVTVEFDVGTWGGDATFNGLEEQCKREAIIKLQNICEEHLKIIGEPSIKVTTFTRP